MDALPYPARMSMEDFLALTPEQRKDVAELAKSQASIAKSQASIAKSQASIAKSHEKIVANQGMIAAMQGMTGAEKLQYLRVDTIRSIAFELGQCRAALDGAAVPPAQADTGAVVVENDEQGEAEAETKPVHGTS